MVDDNYARAYICASARALLRATSAHELIKDLITKNKGLPNPYHQSVEKFVLYMSLTDQKLQKINQELQQRIENA